MRSGMKQGIARGWGAACFLVLPVLLLGSCMSQSDPQVAVVPGDSPAEARDDLLSVLDDTQQLVGGDWDVRDASAARSCTVQWGLRGVTYPALRLATASAVSLAAVESAWKGWGYGVEITTVGPATQLIGTGPGGELLIFRLSDRGMTLQGESACRPAE